MYSNSNRVNAGGAVSHLAEWVQAPKHIPHLFVVSPGNKYSTLPFGGFIYLLLRNVQGSVLFWRCGRARLIAPDLKSDYWKRYVSSNLTGASK